MKSQKSFCSRATSILTTSFLLQALLLFAITFIPQTRASASNTSGTVNNLLGLPAYNAYFVYVGGTPSAGAPPCATQTTGGNPRYAFDPSTAGGKATIATLIMARSLGITVTIVGAGTCNTWGDTEDLTFMITN